MGDEINEINELHGKLDAYLKRIDRNNIKELEDALIYRVLNKKDKIIENLITDNSIDIRYKEKVAKEAETNLGIFNDNIAKMYGFVRTFRDNVSAIDTKSNGELNSLIGDIFQVYNEHVKNGANNVAFFENNKKRCKTLSNNFEKFIENSIVVSAVEEAASEAAAAMAAYDAADAVAVAVAADAKAAAAGVGGVDATAAAKAAKAAADATAASDTAADTATVANTKAKAVNVAIGEAENFIRVFKSFDKSFAEDPNTFKLASELEHEEAEKAKKGEGVIISNFSKIFGKEGEEGEEEYIKVNLFLNEFYKKISIKSNRIAGVNEHEINNLPNLPPPKKYYNTRVDDFSFEKVITELHEHFGDSAKEDDGSGPKVKSDNIYELEKIIFVTAEYDYDVANVAGKGKGKSHYVLRDFYEFNGIPNTKIGMVIQVINAINKDDGKFFDGLLKEYKGSPDPLDEDKNKVDIESITMSIAFFIFSHLKETYDGFDNIRYNYNDNYEAYNRSITAHLSASGNNKKISAIFYNFLTSLFKKGERESAIVFDLYLIKNKNIKDKIKKYVEEIISNEKPFEQKITMIRYREVGSRFYTPPFIDIHKVVLDDEKTQGGKEAKWPGEITRAGDAPGTPPKYSDNILLNFFMLRQINSEKARKNVFLSRVSKHLEKKEEIATGRDMLKEKLNTIGDIYNKLIVDVNLTPCQKKIYRVK